MVLLIKILMVLIRPVIMLLNFTLMHHTYFNKITTYVTVLTPINIAATQRNVLLRPISGFTELEKIIYFFYTFAVT